MKKSRLKWKLFNYKKQLLLAQGMNEGRIYPYGDTMISKLRHIYYEDIPASIILLSDGPKDKITGEPIRDMLLDKPLLLSHAFLGENTIVRLVYADINTLRYDPNISNGKNPLAYDHSYLEVIQDGIYYVYDTDTGLVYEKDYYDRIEEPKIRTTLNKKDIIKYITMMGYDPRAGEKTPEELISIIESKYSINKKCNYRNGKNILRREINLFKDKIQK